MAKSPAIAGGPAGAVIGALADTFGEVQKSLQAMVGTVTQFVQAVSPSTILELSQAFKSLQATIGSAFVGAVQIVSSGVREIAGALLPTMQRLTPVINALANAMTTQLTAGARVVASALEFLAPLIELVAAALSEYSKVFGDVMGVASAALKTLGGLLGNLLGGEMAGIRDTMREMANVVRRVIAALVSFGALLAVYAGGADGVRKFADALAKEAADREKRPGGLLGAASNAQTTDIASIMKQAQQAAFISAGGAGAREKTDTDFLREIAAEMKKVADDRRSLGETLNTWWGEKVLGGVLGNFLTFYFGIQAKISRFLDRF